MLFQFECKTNDRDYYEFNKYHMYSAPDVKKTRLFGKLYVPVLFLFILVYYIILGLDWKTIALVLILFSLLSLIWIFSLKPLGLFFLKLHIRYMKKNGKLPYSDTACLQFYDDYFVEITKDTKTEIQYDAVCKICINEGKAIYLYQNAILAYIVPFNVFESADALESFIEFIKNKTNK